MMRLGLIVVMDFMAVAMTRAVLAGITDVLARLYKRGERV
jgi:hypothetical protein